MSATTVDKYVAKRADLLARLVLTERKGVRVLSISDDTGIDLIAQLPAPSGSGLGRHVQPYLCLQVQGTDEVLRDEDAASAFGKRYWKPLDARGYFLAPVVFLLFRVEGDQGYFSWVMEPQVDRQDGPTLTWVESPEMTKITKKSIEQVFDTTEEWFKATAGLLLRD